MEEEMKEPQQEEVVKTEEKATEAEVKEEKPDKKKKKAAKPQAEGPSQEEYDKLQQEFDDHKQQHLRVLAEYDNFRKRTQNEKTAIYNNAVSDTVQSLLPIADSIQMALSQEVGTAEDLRRGVEMIDAQIKAVFEKLGLQAIGKVGDPFDPEKHNAVAHIDDDSMGENVISAVYQQGYTLGDRVVRHAMVQVAN